MTENDRETLNALSKLIPTLTHLQKEKLLSFGEGMACANDEFRSTANDCPAHSDRPSVSDQNNKG